MQLVQGLDFATGLKFCHFTLSPFGCLSSSALLVSFVQDLSRPSMSQEKCQQI